MSVIYGTKSINCIHIPKHPPTNIHIQKHPQTPKSIAINSPTQTPQKHTLKNNTTYPSQKMHTDPLASTHKFSTTNPHTSISLIQTSTQDHPPTNLGDDVIKLLSLRPVTTMSVPIINLHTVIQRQHTIVQTLVTISTSVP